MQFKKFNSLENTYRQNLIDKVMSEGKSGGQWVVTEKVDGANLSFWCDGETVRVASRTQFVDGTFYNCQRVINLYEDGILAFCKRNGIKQLTVYGELFGDGIQNRVKYGEKDFRAFDVVVNGEILDVDEALRVANLCGVSFVPTLLYGSFGECLEYNNTFRSTLTPDGHEGDNFAEGVVIEPVIPAWFGNGSRIYFKNKSTKFEEKGNKPKLSKEKESLSTQEVALLEELLAYNTESRVVSVISKIGNISNKDFGKILGMTVQDILEDFEKDTGESPKKKVEENWKTFSKQLSSHVGSVVREEFVKHIE